jgi:hypothetical protein
MAITKISDAIVHQQIRDLLANFLNMCFTKVGLAISSTNTKIKTATAATYSVAGAMYTKAATSAITITAGLDTQAVSKFCKYLVSLDASGNFTVTKGSDADTAAAAALPDVPADNTAVGYFQVETDASTTYVPATTALDDSGLTVTYVDLSTVVTES